MVREDAPGDKRLVAYVVAARPSRPGRRCGPRSRRPAARLHGARPRSCALDALPLSANGKLDRAALPAPDATAAAAGATRRAARPAPSELVAAIWREVLGARPRSAPTTTSSTSAGTRCSPPRWWPGCARRRPGHRPAGQRDGPVPAPRPSASWPRSSTRPTAGPRRLLHELTPPVAGRQRDRSATSACPYGGGSAVVYQPLADALPAGHRLFSVAIPGHDVGLDERRAAVRGAGRAAARPRSWTGSTARWSSTATAGSAARSPSRWPAGWRRPAASWRPSTSAAIFPFARPTGALVGPAAGPAGRRWRSNRTHADWLKAHGRRHRTSWTRSRPTGSSRNMRAGQPSAEEYFTALLRPAAGHGCGRRSSRWSASATRSPTTTQERYREWQLPHRHRRPWWCWTRPGTSSCATGPRSWPRSSRPCTRRSVVRSPVAPDGGWSCRAPRGPAPPRWRRRSGRAWPGSSASPPASWCRPRARP